MLSDDWMDVSMFWENKLDEFHGFLIKSRVFTNEIIDVGRMFLSSVEQVGEFNESMILTTHTFSAIQFLKKPSIF